MPIKFLLSGGGLGFLGRGGGWKCRFYFYGRGDFSDPLLSKYSSAIWGIAMIDSVAILRGMGPLSHLDAVLCTVDDTS